MAKQARKAPKSGPDNERVGDDGHEAGTGRPPVVHTGNPRITVAFPFARIETREPGETARDLASLVVRLAEHLDAVTRDVAPGQAEAAELLKADARLLAARLGAGP